MKIYKAHWTHRDTGHILQWFANKRDAERALRTALQETEPDPYTDKDEKINGGPSGVEAIDVPTGKVGLIYWLNQNLNTDNG